jgi:hypothetical protein
MDGDGILLGRPVLMYRYPSGVGSPVGGTFLPGGAFLQPMFGAGEIAFFPGGFLPGKGAPLPLWAPMSQPTGVVPGDEDRTLILTSAYNGMSDAATAADKRAGETVVLSGPGVDIAFGQTR